METNSRPTGRSTGWRRVTSKQGRLRWKPALPQGHSLEGSVLRFGSELGNGRVRIALLGAVELRDSPKMNFGDTNFVVAVLLLFLFLGHELAIAEFALDGEMCALPERRRKRREIAPSDELVPFRSPDVAVAVFVLPGRRRCQGQHREFTLRLRGFDFRVFPYEPNQPH